jgi:hypothetical protein
MNLCKNKQDIKDVHCDISWFVRKNTIIILWGHFLKEEGEECSLSGFACCHHHLEKVLLCPSYRSAEAVLLIQDAILYEILMRSLPPPAPASPWWTSGPEWGKA